MSLTERTQDQWKQILVGCGVLEKNALVHAQAFADTLVGDALSGGEDELDDFLGQILHESAMLSALRENMYYSAKRIREIGFGQPAGSRWRAAAERAEYLAEKPRDLANFLYHSRGGNGDALSDDGWNFRGGAHIMATFKDTYLMLSDLVGQDLTVNPSLVEQPHYALEISLAWWEKKVPDILLGDLVKVTRRVNGGTIGIEHRAWVTNAARVALEQFA
jgi:putative chitinase